MELNGFYNEEELAELLDRNEITKKDFITHHSPELLIMIMISPSLCEFNVKIVICKNADCHRRETLAIIFLDTIEILSLSSPMYSRIFSCHFLHRLPLILPLLLVGKSI